jgi:imidazolonepropionase-like amidohydrolase
MTNIREYVLLSILLCGLAIPAVAKEVTVIKADRVDTVTKGLIENGIIVIEDGRITAIGNDIEIPDTANVIDVRDKTVFPTFVTRQSFLAL